jgi:hypothetical protein
MKKSAQASADAAAMAGAYAAIKDDHFNDPISCGVFGVQCPSSPSSCDLNGNLQAACEYAKQGGFAASDVKIAAGDITTPPPTAQNVGADYWVTVRTAKSIPQLFSAVLGNPTGISSARSTAAIVTVPVNGSLITLNRSTDDPTHPDVSNTGGVLHFHNGLVDSNGADVIPSIDGPVTVLHGSSNPSGMPEGPLFLDPMRGLGQPPLPSSTLPYYAVVNHGNLNSDIYEMNGTLNPPFPTYFGGADVTLPPGNYFPAERVCDPSCHVLLDPNASMDISANVTFAQGGAFGSYFFYGGLRIRGTGTMTMGPGQYVVVGGKVSGFGLSVDGAMRSSDTGDAGQIIILTGMSNNDLAAANLYPGLATQLNGSVLLTSMAINSTNPLGFAQTFFSNSSSGAAVHGLNPAAGGIPSDQDQQNPFGAGLSRFAGVVLWQDQANSTVKYTQRGQIDASCNNNDINHPCTNGYPTNPTITLGSQGIAGMDGLFYQPRGAALISGQGGQNKLQIVTGRFENNGAGLELSSPTVPFKRRIVALIE